ncbi:MAG: BlaI/MecI/CopY family transcriptional regulator [Bacteroidetes bacterium]|nr:MAG: BlaI/MecI/CopY family transcriptional regulator [Bacteroidota bacterium]
MQKLTKAEEELMQVLWDLDRAFLKELMAAIPEPKPAQSTVLTVLRILESKGFVAHEAYGRAFQYYPVVSKEAYAKAYFRQFLGKYFDGSAKRLLSFFSQEGEIDLQDLDEVLKQARDEQDA